MQQNEDITSMIAQPSSRADNPVRILTGVDEIVAAVGEELGVSEFVVVDQKRIDTFADATGDHQWIHVDVDRANAGPYGAPIAHGFLTLSMLPQLAETTYRFDGFAMKVNYGLDRVRFPHPVPAGSRVRLRATLSSVEQTPRGLKTVVHGVVEIENTHAAVCVADTISLLVG